MPPIIDGQHVPPCPRQVNRHEIRRLMEARDFHARHLAHFSGVPLKTLEKILAGETRSPGVSTVDLIAITLEVPIESLLEFAL